ncbi:hypothetical protein OGAPHI_001609 [Ogataea philodendri]|uniref:HTH TFE/IIEalpha-type domain-containing protein n=1 Tax=Ogataea philodendri TaxID=1378263 RepID=A0A9P8PC02_9ASCO|nr:uncharacterized protein OGAPHI_001609 [Ogataea philodendri]KAH3669488.1 hypothetical protein OGAPHI_001609 [Ogataea philodendri]
MSQSKESENEVKNLLRIATRAFYAAPCVLIMEVLLFHSVVYEEDMLKLTCMHRKVFRSYCNRLLEDRLIVAYTQKEDSPQYRMMAKTYFFIRWIDAIDAIKWKIHFLVKMVKDEVDQLSDPQGYMCPSCRTKYSLLDASSLLSDDKTSFECSVCGDKLIEDDSGLEAQKGQEKLERLMSQIEPIIESLKKIDNMKIEDNNFESSLVKAIPATSSSTASYTVSSKVSRANKAAGLSQSLQNAAQKSQATVHVSITADDEDAKLDREMKEQKSETLRQNALPSWHVESTVGKPLLSGSESPSGSEIKKESKDSIKTETPEVESTPQDSPSPETADTAEELDALATYYAQLRANQEEDNDDDDEELDDAMFEDEMS